MVSGTGSRLRSISPLPVGLSLLSSFGLGAWIKREATEVDLIHAEAFLLTVFGVVIGLGLAVSTGRAMIYRKPTTGTSAATLIAFVLGVVIGLNVTAPSFVPPPMNQIVAPSHNATPAE